MKLVEGFALRAHRLVPAPGLRDHHQDRVGQRTAGHHEELEHVVEGRRIAPAFTDHRENLGQIVAEQVRLTQRLAGVHPVDIAPQGVDLAVVGDVAIRMRQRPGRKRVGAEPLMDQR